MMKINYITGSGYWIHKDNIPISKRLNLRSKLSTLDFKTKNESIKAYHEWDEYILIPKISRQMLKWTLGMDLMFTPMYQEHENIKYNKYSLGREPLEHQLVTLEKAYSVFDNALDKRVCICLQPGYGKTYITANIINHLQCKFMFIVYSKDLTGQGASSIMEDLSVKEGILTILHSEDLNNLDPKKCEKVNGVFLTHSMFRECLKKYGMAKMIDIMVNTIGITMKIIDEFDRDVKTMYEIDSFMNFRYNLYLTGTNYKSLREDDYIFQMIFKESTILGKDVVVKPNKDLIIINTKFTPSKKEYLTIMRSDDTFKVYYNNFFAKKDVTLDFIMNRFYHKEDSLMKKMIDEDGKIVFYCGTIINCERVANALHKNHNIPLEDIGIYNSKITSKVKRSENKERKFICSTTKSLGRGYDDRKIRMLVYLEFTFSKPDIIQGISRVGRIGGEYGYVIYPLDYSFPAVTRSFQAKADAGIWKDNFINVYKISVPEEMFKDYTYGYRKDSEEAKAIEVKKQGYQKKLHELL